MKLNLLGLAIAVLHIAAFAAYGDEASKTAKVEEFFRLARMDETLRQSMALAADQVKSGMFQEIMGAKLTPAAQKNLNAFEDKVVGVISDALAWEKLKPAYVKLFVEAYSETELDDIIAFYKSPTGQSMVAKTPPLMTKSSEIVRQRMSEVGSEIQKLMRDFMAQAAEGAGSQDRKK
jgi:hypothetical protein